MEHFFYWYFHFSYFYGGKERLIHYSIKYRYTYIIFNKHQNCNVVFGSPVPCLSPQLSGGLQSIPVRPHSINVIYSYPTRNKLYQGNPQGIKVQRKCFRTPVPGCLLSYASLLINLSFEVGATQEDTKPPQAYV